MHGRGCDMPKISVVLPVYNGERYLKCSIDSILAQSFTDFELIIVDDCSTDETAHIVDMYARQDRRIHLIHNKTNQRLPQSLNIGFKKARGEYLTWTSDDNIYLPNAFSVMINYMEKNSYKMVCADMELIDEKGCSQGNRQVYNEEDFYYENFVGACFMYQQKVLQEIGGYDKSFFLVEDYEYWMRIFKTYGKIGHIEQILYQYREHGASLSATRRIEINKSKNRLRKKYIKNIIDYYALKGDIGKNRLLWLYLEFCWNQEDVSDFYDDISKIVPEIDMICNMECKNNIAVYGAGVRGNQAYRKYSDRISFFIDRKADDIVEKNGIKVLTLTDYLKSKRGDLLLVAIGKEHLLNVMHTLYAAGINKCVVFPWE